MSRLSNNINKDLNEYPPTLSDIGERVRNSSVDTNSGKDIVEEQTID